MAQQQPPKAPPTTGERARNFLLYGIGLSILLHLLLGPLVKFNRTVTEETKTQKVTVIKAPTPPPPTPTPKPTPPPTPTPPPKSTPPPEKQTPEPQVKNVLVKTIKTTNKGKGPTEHSNTLTKGDREAGNPSGNSPTGAPASTAPSAAPAPPTPTPSPPATPKPSCAVPNDEPKVLDPALPETPAIAQSQGITGTVEVQVDLDANSRILATRAVSGPSLLRNAAISATKASKFRTEVRNCLPQAATYRYIVEFTNG